MNMPFVVKDGYTVSWMETLGFGVFALLTAFAVVVMLLLVARVVKYALTGSSRF